MKIKRSLTTRILRSLIKAVLFFLLKIQAPFWLHNRRFEEMEIKNILIFAYMGIGDMLMFTPALKLLRQKYPNAKITLQTGLKNSVELVVQNSNLINSVGQVLLDNNFIKFIKYGFRNRKKYDLLISEFHNPYYQLAFQVLYMQIPLRITHQSSTGYKNPFDFLFNFQIRMRENEHTIERELDLLGPIGIESNFATAKRSTQLWLADSDLKFADNFWQEHHYENEFVVGIQAGTAPLGRWKQWPIENFRRLVQELNLRKYKILLFGSPSEREMIEKIAIEITPAPLILAGHTTFLQACALIGKCNYMFTNDSGLMHVANALGVPLTAIYGPTDYHRTAPLGDRSQMVSLGLACSPCFKLEGDEDVAHCPTQYKCLRELTVEKVLESAQLVKTSV